MRPIGKPVILEDIVSNRASKEVKSTKPITPLQQQEKTENKKEVVKNDNDILLSKPKDSFQIERPISLKDNTAKNAVAEQRILDTVLKPSKPKSSVHIESPISLEGLTVESIAAESGTLDTVHNSSRFSISLGGFVQRPSARIRSSNAALQALYENGKIKKWNVNAELQAEYKLNKKWSLGAGISMSSYATEIGKSNFEKETVSNIEMDTTKKTIKFISSMGELQLDNLNDFEFGRIPTPVAPDKIRQIFVF